MSSTLESHEDAIRSFLIQQIQREQDGVTLRELIEAASDQHYNENDVRVVLRMLEQLGQVNADWDWKYKIVISEE